MVKVAIAGDFCDCGRVTPLIKDGRYSEIFSEVKPIIEAADYSLVNFEFPILEGEPTPILKCGPCLSGQKETIDAIKYAGFKCATLANNHILDQGEDNCLYTKDLLERAGVDTVGVGENVNEASKILYKTINGEKLAVINCCEHEFSIATENTAGANALNPIQQFYSIQEARKSADYVLVVAHGGHEHYQLPSPRMKETYRFFIDAGADAVVNHHQHCFSGYEIYKGKPIFYGLGNFLFDKDGKRDTIWNEGYLVELNLDKFISFELKSYVQCNDKTAISPMTGEKRTYFEQDIYRLCSIISNDSWLSVEYKQLCESKYNNLQLIFTPYTNRISLGLVSRHLLPRFLSLKHVVRMLNYINCESHRDNVVSMFKALLK